MRPKPAAVLVLVLATFAISGTAVAYEEATTIEIWAFETEQDCPEEPPCLVDGFPGYDFHHWEDIAEGERVFVRLYNNGTHDHGLVLADLDRVEDPGNGTNVSDTLARIGPVPPGEEYDDQAFNVPDDIDAVYAYCPIDDHEEQGMHATYEVLSAENEASNAGSPEGDDAQVPTLGLPLAMALAVLTATALPRGGGPGKRS